MRLALELHPDLRCDAVAGVDVDITRKPSGQLSLHYIVKGMIDALKLPAMAEPRRADELWQRTCFEVFIRPHGSLSYFEVNLSPSTEWAAYQFDGYREGMRPLPGIVGPCIETKVAPNRYELQAKLDFEGGATLANGIWHVGLTAVIEETNGRKSYWALAHPPGKPDFHHTDCFVLELPPA